MTVRRLYGVETTNVGSNLIHRSCRDFGNLFTPFRVRLDMPNHWAADLPRKGRVFMLQVRRGFTLVELLVVVFILAVLIAILLPTLNKARERAMRVKMESESRSVTGQAVAAIDRAVEQAAMVHAHPLAEIHSLSAEITLTPRLSVGTDQPESIYEARFAAKLQASRSSSDGGEEEIQLPLPPQVISLGDLVVNVNGRPSDALTMRDGKLLWQGAMPADVPVDFDVTYTAMGRGLYALQTPPSKILDHFQIKLTAKGSDVRMLELSMQPTSLVRGSGQTVYNWDYKRLLFGRPIALDVLGIAPIDRLGELSWLGPLSVVAFGLILGLVSRAYRLEQFDRWMLVLVLGTFTSAFPLMYFAQGFIPLTYAMIAAAVIVLVVIGMRAKSIIGLPLTIGGVVMPAGAIMALTLVAAIRPNLQGMILTILSLGLFIAAMMLAPRIHVRGGMLPGAPAAA